MYWRHTGWEYNLHSWSTNYAWITKCYKTHLLAVKPNYPNKFDLYQTKCEGRTSPRSNIFIRGKRFLSSAWPWKIRPSKSCLRWRTELVSIKCRWPFLLQIPKSKIDHSCWGTKLSDNAPLWHWASPHWHHQIISDHRLAQLAGITRGSEYLQWCVTEGDWTDTHKRTSRMVFFRSFVGKMRGKYLQQLRNLIDFLWFPRLLSGNQWGGLPKSELVLGSWVS